MNATIAPQDSLAQALRNARQTLEQIEYVNPAWDGLSEHEAYQTMLAVTCTLGWPALGWKIAGTNTDMQRQLRSSGPVFGRTFQRFHMHSPGLLINAQLLDPIVESEFFFRIGATLPPRERHYPADEVSDAVEAVFIGIEVAECRFSRHHLPTQNALIADGFASGRYVQGREVPNWQTALRDPVAVSVHRNRELRANGTSRDVMGHPINAVTWLTNRLSRMGLPLQRGELVSSGSCTGMVRARARDHIESLFGSLGSVSIDFV